MLQLLVCCLLSLLCSSCDRDQFIASVWKCGGRKITPTALTEGPLNLFLLWAKSRVKRCPLSVYTNMFDALGYCCHSSAQQKEQKCWVCLCLEIGKQNIGLKFWYWVLGCFLAAVSLWVCSFGISLMFQIFGSSFPQISQLSSKL